MQINTPPPLHYLAVSRSNPNVTATPRCYDAKCLKHSDSQHGCSLYLNSVQHTKPYYDYHIRGLHFMNISLLLLLLMSTTNLNFVQLLHTLSGRQLTFLRNTVCLPPPLLPQHLPGNRFINPPQKKITTFCTLFVVDSLLS